MFGWLLAAHSAAGSIAWSDRRLMPSEAAKVLAASLGLSSRTGRFVCADSDGPHVIVIASSPEPGQAGRNVQTVFGEPAVGRYLFIDSTGRRPACRLQLPAHIERVTLGVAFS
jgi:hypothetical protein